MDSNEKFKYWLETAEYDLATAEAMHKTGRWLYVLFMCQQAVEKLVKGLYILYLDDDPPRTHNINFLVAKFEDKLPSAVTDDQKQLFQKLTAYYISGRYPEYKDNIGSKLNETAASEILKETKEVFEWLLTLKL